ncbi:hypothetical protein OA801_22680 [Citrobacter portucalensis]|nr:hypothetical protein [Citrobacter portucalensis]MDN4361279.1 hypothetical protein [Citrobacter portucalensis]MDN4366024.1 hypothetical protein [Citrobacter portucalensis]MDN4376039.1 hypothetical protein [Citrobacter portucalensis]MDN4381531.1 hypothetical protein [Citrobacter portucalensis]MDN4391241.1 hypothetical protein [Citrobacter portucalensis]
MTTVTRERLTKILIETMALIKQRSSCTGHSSGISSEVNTELFAEITRLALASLDAVASYPEKLPCPVFLEPGLRFGKGVTTSLMLGALQRRAEYYAELDAMTPDQRAEHDAGIAEFKAMLGQPIITDNFDLITDKQPEPVMVAECEICGKGCTNAGHPMKAVAVESPVIGIDPALGPDRSVEIRYVAPPGWVMVPIEPTEHMIVEGFESEPDEFFSEPEVWKAYQAMSGCRQAAHRAKLCWAAMIAAVPTKEGA